MAAEITDSNELSTPGDAGRVDIQLVAHMQASSTDNAGSEHLSVQDGATSIQSGQLAASPEFQNAYSLTQLCGIALSNSPDLITMRQSESVSLAAKGVAETYPFNPYVQFQATPIQDVGNGAPNHMYHYVLLMQTIQLAHQQEFREQGARFALNSTRWNIHQAELQTLAQTQRLYFAALYQRGIRELADQSLQNNLKLLQIAEHQLEAGDATAADVSIVKLDSSSARQQRQLADASYQNALRDLARQIGMAPDALVDVAGDLHQFHWMLPDATTLQCDNAAVVVSAGDWQGAVDESRSSAVHWSRSRPDVMAARSDIDVTRANLGLASAAKTPDLQIGPYYQSTADNSTFLGFRAQMDLPVINNGEPLERQRMAEHRQRVTNWSQVQRRAEMEATAAIERYATALSVVQSNLQDNASIDLPIELAGLEKQFREGEVAIVRVVQARTSLLLNRRAQLDLLNELGQAAAGLVAATGMPMETFARLN